MKYNIKSIEKKHNSVTWSPLNIKKMVNWLDEEYPSAVYQINMDNISFEDETVAFHCKMVWG